MSNYGIRMSKPGVDVKTASDADLSWSSDFKTFKIYRIVKFTANTSINHGLSYPPAFATININTLQFFGLGKSYVSVDSQKVYGGPVDGQTLYVILFVDPLNE
jgi:hypothetical protein